MKILMFRFMRKKRIACDIQEMKNRMNLLLIALAV